MVQRKRMLRLIIPYTQLGILIFGFMLFLSFSQCDPPINVTIPYSALPTPLDENNLSDDTDFIESTMLLGPQLIIPAHGMQTVSLAVIFAWENHKETSYSNLYIAKDKELKEIVAQYYSVTSPYPLPEPLGEGEYFWTIKSAIYDTMYQAEVRSLQIVADGPSITQPAAESLVTFPLEFHWESFTDAASYCLQISISPYFDSLLRDICDLTDVTYSQTEVLEPGTYHYRIQVQLKNGLVQNGPKLPLIVQ